MELFFQFTLFLSGVLNLLPAVLVFAPKRLEKSYGIQMTDENQELLLRHRACLFGIVGGILVYASIAKEFYELATLVGLVSMVSFVILYFVIPGSKNANLKKVMLTDVVLSAFLLAGYFLNRIF